LRLVEKKLFETLLNELLFTYNCQKKKSLIFFLWAALAIPVHLGAPYAFLIKLYYL